MDVDIKEEPPLDIEGYLLADETVGQDIDLSEDSQECPRKKRKQSKAKKNSHPTDTSEEMQQLLREWGLEVLCERFSKNLIDLSLLDYIVDVDIVELCRDLPMKYRLILRHKLAEKRGQCVHDDSNEQKRYANLLKYITTALEKSKKKPLPQQNQEEQIPKPDICPVELALEKPFATRSEDEKRLLVSMDIPHPPMPELKTYYVKGTQKISRKFNTSHYDSEWWLCGSQKRNKIFCWPCLLFTSPNDLQNGVWTRKGFNDLNHLSASLKAHRTAQKHVDNVKTYENFGKQTTATDSEAPLELTIAGSTANEPKRIIIIRANSGATSNGGNTKLQTNDNKVRHKSSAQNVNKECIEK